MKSSRTNHTTTYFMRNFGKVAVLGMALMVITFCSAHAEQVTAGVSFAQVSFTASNPPVNYSHYGQVSVDFTMLYGEGYINVERYENGVAAGWVVKNLPVINGSILSGFGTMFDLQASGYQSSFSAYVDYSTTPLADDSSLRNQVPQNYPLAQFEDSLGEPAKQYDVSFEIVDCKNPTKIQNLKQDYGSPLTKGAVDFCLLNDLNEKGTNDLIISAGVRWDNPLAEPPSIGGPPFFEGHGYAKSQSIAFIKGGGTGIPKDGKTFVLHIKDFTGAKKVFFAALKIQ